MREFTQLGAGFKIALRDLEIRGAGNLLGAEQHGFVASVGFDLYCQLLSEAVQALRGKKQEKPPEVEIKLPIDAYFPSRYIREGRQKVEMYKKVAAAQKPEDMEDILDELLDRYGDLPDPVTNLLNVARLRIAASKLGVTLVTATDAAVMLRLGSHSPLRVEQVLRTYARFSELSLMENNKGMTLKWQTQETPGAGHLPRLLSALAMLAEEEVTNAEA
jgi:transcription-repair coupling factor (superfamily II helicase)